MASPPQPYLTPEEYLELDRAADRKSEYFDGQVFAMAGASLRHNRIVGNLIVGIGSRLRDAPCEALPSVMRMRATARAYTYPDVSVVCGKPQLADQRMDILLNPTVLIEVLSDSTERTDRGRKALHYRRIESLREYLLVRQDEARIEQYIRRGADDWRFVELVGLDVEVRLDSIACALPLREVYSGAL